MIYPRNDNIEFRLGENSYINCCSFLIMNKDDEILIIKENRCDKNGEKRLLYHTIGGKVEKTDPTPLFTALREFCEESNFSLGSETIQKLEDEISEIDYHYIDSFCAEINNIKIYNRYYLIYFEDFKYQKEVLDICNDNVFFINLQNLPEESYTSMIEYIRTKL